MKALRFNRAHLFIAVLPALAMLVLIHHYAVKVPVTDQYEFVPIFQSLDHGHIPFGLFWAQHNEHRIFFPNVILVTMARLTHWNVLAEVYLSFITACVTFYGIYLLMSRLVKDNLYRLVGTVLAAIIFFSPTQYENWTWGWQFEWYLCVACIIWVFKFTDMLKRESDIKRLILPGVIAFVASFSLGSGLLAWLGGLIILVSRRFKASYIGAWLATALLSACLYYFHYHKPDDGLSNTSFIGHPAAFAKQFLAYIGRPISDDARMAVFAGIYIVIIYVLLVSLVAYRKKIAQTVPALGLGAIALVVGLMTGVARFDLGMAGALASRYTAFSELLLISGIMLLLALLSDVKRMTFTKRLLVAMSIVALLLPALTCSWLTGINDMRTQSHYDRYIYVCSRQAHPDHACLYAIYFPSPSTALTRLNYLKQHHYGGY